MTGELLRLMRDEREIVIGTILRGEISKENVGSKNFSLGKLELLNDLLDDDLYGDLVAALEGEI